LSLKAAKLVKRIRRWSRQNNQIAMLPKRRSSCGANLLASPTISRVIRQLSGTARKGTTW
jgi:hypothetical protein